MVDLQLLCLIFLFDCKVSNDEVGEKGAEVHKMEDECISPASYKVCNIIFARNRGIATYYNLILRLKKQGNVHFIVICLVKCLADLHEAFEAGVNEPIVDKDLTAFS